MSKLDPTESPVIDFLVLYLLLTFLLNNACPVNSDYNKCRYVLVHGSVHLATEGLEAKL